jgi:hypothetical protein
MIVSTAALLISLASPQGAKPVDRWPAPSPRVFASSDGAFGFKVLPSGDVRGATGTLFTIDPTGAEKPVWTRILTCLPVEVRISNQGHVATLDVWGGKGKEHALVLYDRNGKTVADHALSELFEFAAPAKNPFFLTTPSSIHWTMSVEIGYDLRNLRPPETPTASGALFALRGVWKETVVFDPDTGKLLYRQKAP